jgi:hypothetical protein
LESKLFVARKISRGRRVPKDNEIRLTGKAGFEKTDIFRLVSWRVYRYFLEDAFLQIH